MPQDPAPRRAASLALRAILFTIALPGTVLGLLPAILLRLDPWRPAAESVWLRAAGVAMIGAGAVGYAACVREFALRGRGTPAPWDAPVELVSSGFFRGTRNPMYTSVLLVLAGEVCCFASPVLGLHGLLVAAVFHLMVVLYEEPVLQRRFGEPYRQYLREVPRWAGRPRRAR